MRWLALPLPFLAVWLVACAHTGLEPRPDLIQQFSFELVQEEPFIIPFMAYFHRGADSLYFVATKPSYRTDSDAFQRIQRAFQQEKFKLVIVEGTPESYGINPALLLESARKNARRRWMPGGEAAYAALLADQRGIPVLGGEPDEKEIVAEVLRQPEMTRRDLLGYYFVRELPKMDREGTLREKEIGAAYRDFLPRQAIKAGLLEDAATFDFDHFKRWYKDRNGKPFALKDFEGYEEVVPLADGEMFTQKVASVIFQFRSRHLFELATRKLNEVHEVMIVYGTWHLAIQRPAWVAMLGQPRRQH